MKRRILVVGTGGIGRRHLQCLAATDRALLAACDPSESARSLAAETAPDVALFPTLDAALEKNWDGAIVAAPADVHVALAQRLLDAGAGVLIEKPLCVSLEGVDALSSQARRLDLVAGVAYVYRAHPGLALVRQRIAAGDLGEVAQYQVTSGQHYPTFRPDYREIYYADRSRGGGIVWDMSSHFFDWVQWLFGPVTRVAADADHRALPGVAVEDTFHAMLRHGPIMGQFGLNQHQAPNETILTVVGSEATLRFSLLDNEIQIMREPCGRWEVEPLGAVERNDWFIRQETAFLDALDGKGAPLCPLDEGIQTQRVLDAVAKSIQSGGGFVDVAPARR